MSEPLKVPSVRVLRQPIGLSHEGVLALALALEIAVFSVAGTNFLSRANAFEIVRLSVEIGLLALALTPVIVTGGIDLSVGSLMGLSAVRLRHAVARCRVADPAGGGRARWLSARRPAALNGLLITRLRLPPLIVTLGTFSLFRGLAEGLTRGVDNFTGFPDSFLFLGQGYLLGGVPAQLPVFVVVAVGFWWLLHRTTIGRGAVRDRLLAGRRPLRRAFRSSGGWRWSICSRAASPAWRRSSMSPTWARRRPMPARATS